MPDKNPPESGNGDFAAYYENVLKPGFSVVAGFRAHSRRNLRRIASIALPIAAVSAGTALLLTDFAAGICWGVSIVAVAVFLVYLFPYLSGSEEKILFKKTVMPKLVQFFDPSLKFQSDSCISSSCYDRSGLFPDPVDYYSGEDLVFGYYHGVHLHFSELKTEREDEYRDSKGNVHKVRRTIFDGVFLVADFQKDFHFRTFVLPDVAERFFGKLVGGFFQKMNLTQEGSLIRLEDPDFEKEFAVYAEDPVEARYLLTPALMHRFVEMKRRFASPMRFSFVDSCLCLAISRSDNLFELSELNHPGFRSAKRCHDQLLMFLRIVDDLNMNIRIWTKR